MRFSIEREFFLYKRNRKPASRTQTDRFAREAKRAFRRHKLKEHLDLEVARNGIELVMPFTTLKDYKDRYEKALKVLLEVANDHLLIFPLSQRAPGNNHHEFFTTLAFPDSIKEFESTAGIHLHIAVSSYKEMFEIYNLINKMKAFDRQELPWLPGGRKGILKELEAVVHPLSSYKQLSSLEEYKTFIEQLNKEFSKRFNGRLRLLKQRYPKMFPNGRLSLTPDKIFTPNARARPDLTTKEYVGSVEIRFLDGSSSIEQDIEKIKHVIEIIEGKEPLEHFEYVYVELEQAIELFNIAKQIRR